MAKTTKKQPRRSKKLSASGQKRLGQRNGSNAWPAVRSGTKQDRAIEMLRSKNGASISALMEATGWQQHSVRGFLAGVVRKRLKLNLISDVNAGERTYRITGEPAAPASKVQGAQPKSS